MMGAGDKRFDVREEAARGLKPAPKPSKVDAKAAADAADEATFPTLAALLSYVAERHPRLSKPAEPGEQLLMEPRSFETLVGFAQLCWQKQFATTSGDAAAVSCAWGRSRVGVAPESMMEWLVCVVLVVAAPVHCRGSVDTARAQC